MFRYRLVNQRVPAMWRNLAAARLMGVAVREGSNDARSSTDQIMHTAAGSHAFSEFIIHIFLCSRFRDCRRNIAVASRNVCNQGEE